MRSITEGAAACIYVLAFLGVRSTKSPGVGGESSFTVQIMQLAAARGKATKEMNSQALCSALNVKDTENAGSKLILARARSTVK